MDNTEKAAKITSAELLMEAVCKLPKEFAISPMLVVSALAEARIAGAKHGREDTIDALLAILPERVTMGEQYGIMMMPCNRNEWHVCYFNTFIKDTWDVLPSIVKPTLKECLVATIEWFKEHYPKLLRTPEKPSEG